MKYYKVLSAKGKACNGGKGKWFLPKGKRPGKWMPKIEGKLIACNNGYHLCRPRDLSHWLGPRIFEVETRGEMLETDDKVVVREARLLRETDWNERTARLFACDCAEHVLPIFEKNHPEDKRPREAIKTARKFADGEATREELAAACDAAWAAAHAAYAATATAAYARAAATYAAYAAATYAAYARAAATAAYARAAYAAAHAAATYAAEAAERKWQLKRLMHYLDTCDEEE